MAKVNPKPNSPARSLIALSPWDQPDWFTKWDVAAPADRIDGNGLGELPQGSLPAVNSGDRITAGSPQAPRGLDPTEETPYAADRALPFNTPGRSDQAANLKSSVDMGWTSTAPPWNAPKPSADRFRPSSNPAPGKDGSNDWSR